VKVREAFPGDVRAQDGAQEHNFPCSRSRPSTQIHITRETGKPGHRRPCLDGGGVSARAHALFSSVCVGDCDRAGTRAPRHAPARLFFSSFTFLFSLSFLSLFLSFILSFSLSFFSCSVFVLSWVTALSSSVVLSQTGVRRHSELGWAQLENFCLSGAGGFNSAHTVASGQTYSTLMTGEKRSFFLASFL
jgi:hypothetical protein